MVRVKCGVKRLFMKPSEDDKKATKDEHWIIAGEQFNFHFRTWEEESTQQQCQWKKPRLQDGGAGERGSHVETPHSSRIGRFQAPTPSSISTFTAAGVALSNASAKTASDAVARVDKPKLLVMRGDPTDWSPAAIVNDTDSWLLHQRGLAATIVRKGGPEIRRQSDEWIHYQGQVKVGSAMWTTAGNLPSRFVIHTVGPDVSYRWLEQQQQQLELRQAVRSALAVAATLEVTSVAMPALSTGSGRCYPRHLAAREIVAECLQFCDDCPSATLRLIVLMSEDELTTSIFAEALKEERQRRQLQRQCLTRVVPTQPARVKRDGTHFHGSNDYLPALLQKLKQTDEEEKGIATAAASRLATLKKWAL